MHKQIWIRRVYSFCSTNFKNLKLHQKVRCCLSLEFCCKYMSGVHWEKLGWGKKVLQKVLRKAWKSQPGPGCSIDLCSCLTEDRGKSSGKWYFQISKWNSDTLKKQGLVFGWKLFMRTFVYVKSMRILSLKWAYLEIWRIKLYFKERVFVFHLPHPDF